MALRAATSFVISLANSAGAPPRPRHGTGAALFALGHVGFVVDLSCEDIGVVKTQSPAAGTYEPPGTAVSIVIGKAGGKCLRPTCLSAISAPFQRSMSQSRWAARGVARPHPPPSRGT